MRFSPKDCGLTEETASGFRLETMRSICRTALIGSMHARFWHTLGRSATLFSAKQKARFLPPWFDAFSRPGSGIALRHPAIRQVHMRNPIRLESGKAPPCPPAFRSRKDCFLFALRPHGRFINGAFPRGLLLICERCKSEAFFQNNAHAPHIRRLILC